MPGMNGYEVVAAIQQLPHCRDIPFIFLTAMADRAAQRRGMELGADDYLTKPCSERDLLEAIAARVRRQQPLRERIATLLAERPRAAGAGWSHELLTPLNGVLGGLQLIEAEADSIRPEELKELLGLIREGAERQQALAQKIILFHELERLRTAPRPAVPPVCNAAEGVAAGARAGAGRLKGQANVTVEATPAAVTATAAYLSAAVAELTDNALRFSPPGQPVTVTGRCEGARYLIEITDQGPGLTAEQCRAIGPFVQFERARREQQGLGLGLATARTIAELGGGELRLAPAPSGHGLRAILDLPTA
jgi:signal transduction histidine kinase